MSTTGLSLRAGTTIALGVVLSMGSVAFGQRAMTVNQGWTFTPPLLNPSALQDQAFATGPTRTVSGSGVLVQGRLRTVQDGDGDVDSAVFGVGPLRYTFTLLRDSDVYVPLLLDAQSIFTHVNAGANAGRANVIVRAELWRESAATPGLFEDTALFRQISTTSTNNGAAGTSNLTDTLYNPFGGLTASDTRRYQIRYSVSLDVNSYGGVPFTPNNGEVNSQIDLRFNTSSQGMFGSVVAVPTGYNGNSRAAVGAATARTGYGVDGSGGVGGTRANVGVLEPGVSYTNHVSLLNRVTTLDNGGAAGRRDEHTLAVTSIIASGQPPANNIGETGMGVAPGARVATASIGDYGGTIAGAQAIVNHYGVGERVTINYSASDGNCTVEALDRFITANPNVTWVNAGGNEQLSGPWPSASPPAPPALGNVETPEYAYNAIAVGAMEGNFARPTDFSSTTGGLQPITPHIMAPGEYTLAAQSRDTNGNGQVDDFGRTFLGDDYRFAGATTGQIAGTSFAAPHVTGAVALMFDYAGRNPTRFDGTSCDHRVIKAILLAGATTQGIQDRAGNAWSQGRAGAGVDGNPVLVHRSLDPNLGSGLLNVPTALRIMSGGEARAADFTPSNAPRNAQISANWNSSINTIWDYETVGARTGAGPAAVNGTVDYFLPSTLFAGVLDGGDQGVVISPQFSYLRSCLTWDATVTGATYDPLANLELRLYVDRPGDPGNIPGFDSANPLADILLAQTDGAGENVRLLDLSAITTIVNIQAPDQVVAGWSFYLQVCNTSTTATTYGLAISLVPAPSGAGVLMLVGVFATRRRRRA